MSVLFDILDGLRTQLRENVPDLIAGDPPHGIAAIPEENIVIRPLQFDVTLWTRWRDELSPGLVLSPSQHVQIDPTAGTNKRDDVEYNFWVFGIDRDDTRADEHRMKVWYERSQALRRYLNMQNLQALNADGIVLTLAWTPEIALYSDPFYKLYHLWQISLPLTVKVREPRDTTGAA